MRHILAAFTGKDNQSVDISRVLLALSVVSVIALEAVAVYVRGQTFEPHTFAIALGALLFGGCAGTAIKSGTEPEPESK